MIIAPEAFAAEWDTPLITLPLELSRTGVDAEALEFLQRGGLPEGLSYGQKDGAAHLSFARLRRGLTPLLQALPSMIRRAPAWKDHVVLGQEWFEGGASPFWCLHDASGRVEVIDIESDDETPGLVNTSVAHLAQTLLTFRSWVRQIDMDARSLTALRAALQQADLVAWRSSRWSRLLDHLESVPVTDIICEAAAQRVATLS
jgi:hypothetical protein